MKHLFIINPKAARIKGKAAAVTEEINGFFKSYPQIKYDIHITRWCRDAVGFTRRYVSGAGEIVRVHVIGGTGTLFEVANGVIGLPNVQLAVHPFGRCNTFLQFFGKGKTHLFSSMRNQVFSNTTPIDAIRCGRIYGICHGTAGLEAIANMLGDKWISTAPFPADYCYLGAAFYTVFTQKHFGFDYKVTVDGESYDGRYITMMTANQPCYGSNLYPAVDAHPNDGVLDLYMVKYHSKLKFIKTASIYTSGNYRKIPDIITHIRCNKVSISSEQPICIDIDGETFYESTAVFEIIPYAVDFVCPEGIDPWGMPRIYKGRRGIE